MVTHYLQHSSDPNNLDLLEILEFGNCLMLGTWLARWTGEDLEFILNAS